MSYKVLKYHQISNMSTVGFPMNSNYVLFFRNKPLIRVGVMHNGTAHNGGGVRNDKSALLEESLQHAVFRPGAKSGVVFVAHNDIYFMPEIVTGGQVIFENIESFVNYYFNSYHR